MLENSNIEQTDSQEAKNSSEEPETIIKKPRKRRRSPAKKQGWIAGLWPKIAIAAIVLCLILAGVSISMVNKEETAPVIQNVSISDIAQTSAIINWQTDKPVTSEIIVCRSDNCTSLKLDKSMIINHSATLTDIEPGIRYQLILVARNEQNKEARFALELVTPSKAAAPVDIPPAIGHGVGERAPDFTLLTLDGKQESLSQFRGKIVMLNFWQSSCPVCAEETPYIQAVFDEWPRDKLQILAVSVNERDMFVRVFLNTRGLTFPTLLDSDGAVSKIYGSPASPTTFFINADGIIKGIKTGHFTSRSEIETMLKSL
jgi:peroxiredoxin